MDSQAFYRRDASLSNCCSAPCSPSRYERPIVLQKWYWKEMLVSGRNHATLVHEHTESEAIAMTKHEKPWLSNKSSQFVLKHNSVRSLVICNFPSHYQQNSLAHQHGLQQVHKRTFTLFLSFSVCFSRLRPVLKQKKRLMQMSSPCFVVLRWLRVFLGSNRVR